MSHDFTDHNASSLGYDWDAHESLEKDIQKLRRMNAILAKGKIYSSIKDRLKLNGMFQGTHVTPGEFNDVMNRQRQRGVSLAEGVRGVAMEHAAFVWRHATEVNSLYANAEEEGAVLRELEEARSRIDTILLDLNNVTGFLSPEEGKSWEKGIENIVYHRDDIEDILTNPGAKRMEFLAGCTEHEKLDLLKQVAAAEADYCQIEAKAKLKLSEAFVTAAAMINMFDVSQKKLGHIVQNISRSCNLELISAESDLTRARFARCVLYDMDELKQPRLPFSRALIPQ